jgi:hypothetical protein
MKEYYKTKLGRTDAITHFFPDKVLRSETITLYNIGELFKGVSKVICYDCRFIKDYPDELCLFELDTLLLFRCVIEDCSKKYLSTLFSPVKTLHVYNSIYNYGDVDILSTVIENSNIKSIIAYGSNFVTRKLPHSLEQLICSIHDVSKIINHSKLKVFKETTKFDYLDTERLFIETKLIELSVSCHENHLCKIIDAINNNMFLKDVEIKLMNFVDIDLKKIKYDLRFNTILSQIKINILDDIWVINFNQESEKDVIIPIMLQTDLLCKDLVKMLCLFIFE